MKNLEIDPEYAGEWPIVVTTLTQTCSACPSQWEGRTADNRAVYIRYRHGYLRIEVSEPGGTQHGTDTVAWLETEWGDGDMTLDELRSYCVDEIRLPESAPYGSASREAPTHEEAAAKQKEAEAFAEWAGLELDDSPPDPNHFSMGLRFKLPAEPERDDG